MITIRLRVLLVALLVALAIGAFSWSRTAISSPQLSGKIAAVNGVNIYYREQGKGEPLLLLHGGMGTLESWSHQAPEFSKRYRVITPDSRGQGRSTDGTGPLTYHDMAEDMIALMDKLQVKTAYIVGWSDGGNIGLDMAINHPDRVKALVAYGANGSIAGLQQSFVDYLTKASVDQLVKDMGSEYLAVSPRPEYLPIIANKVRNMWLKEPNFTKTDYEKIRAPSLILDGETEEFILPSHACEIAGQIANSRCLLLSGVGHFAMANDTRRFNQTVLQFLAANP